MEKYGVTELEPPKTAEEADTQEMCPACGSVLESTDTVNVYKCPKCGTKPFEGSSSDDTPR